MKENLKQRQVSKEQDQQVSNQTNNQTTAAVNQPTQQAEQVQQQQQPQQQPQQQFSVFRMIFFYWVVSSIISFFNPPDPKKAKLFENIYKPEQPFKLNFIISKSMNPYDHSTVINKWTEDNLYYNFNYTQNDRTKNITLNIEDIYKLPQLYCHVIAQAEPNEEHSDDDDIKTLYTNTKKINLIQFLKPKKVVKLKSLIYSKNETEEEEQPEQQQSDELLPHIAEVVYVYMVHDTTHYHPAQIPPTINLTMYRTEEMRVYQPILNTEQFWRLERHNQLLSKNNTQKQIDIQFVFGVQWHYKYLMEVQMVESMRIQSTYGMDSDLNQVKEMFMDTNIILLSVTMVVSMLHSIFEMLAIKNDIAFWKDTKSHQGLSLRTLYVNLFVDIVVFFYLLDNETSSMIIFFSGIEILVTIWKIGKTNKFIYKNTFPYIEFERQEVYESTTAKYDKIAMKYLSYLCVPLFVCYTIYSIMYEEHKGLYSFILQTLVGYIYVFGFIQMTPQLYINYRLKSVSHLPWRTLIYKFLNTIIDDLFAFIITMPWLKRLACFRDDIIFVIYLYQRWIYRVDPTRTESGFREEEEKKEEQKILEDNKNNKEKNE